MREFDGPRERIYVSMDELVITISFDDPSNKRTLPNEWIYLLKRQDLEGVKRECSALIFRTKAGQNLRVTLFNLDEAFEEISQWIGVEGIR